MMNKLRSVFAACLSVMLLLAITVPGFAASADPATGTPTLEINLGADNAGAEFYFKTDAGIMPGTLAADQNGVLTLELGGSSKYILTYAAAAAGMPSTSENDESTTAEPASDEETGYAEPTTEASESEGAKKPPLKDMLIFFGGIAICGGFLLGSKIYSVIKEKKSEKDEDSEPDDYDY